MGDRGLVRQGSLVIALALALSALPPSRAAENSGSSAPKPKLDAKPEVREPIELRPYRIRAWLAIDPRARLDDKGRALLIADWTRMARRFVGPAWELSVADGEGPLAAGHLEAVEAKELAPLTRNVDKGWMIAIGPGSGEGYELTAREYDATAGHLGLVFRRPAPYPHDLARNLFQLSLEIFAPFAEVGDSSAGGVSVTVQAAALQAGDPIGRVVAEGTVFQPARIYQRGGKILRIQPILWSYLRVDSLEGPVARCSIISSLRDPLSKRVIGKNRLIALGLKPASVPTKFRFVTPPLPGQAGGGYPAAGYTLTVKRLPDGQRRDLGTTDREGRIVLPPGFADGLLMFRLLAGGLEPVAEFPSMPGETAMERPIRIRPVPSTVTLESRLNALKDEIVDQVAIRKRFETRLKSRFDAQAYDEVKAILGQYATLRKRDAYVERLTKMRTEAETEQKQTKKPVLTRTAQAQLADAEALIMRYIDDEIFAAYERGLKEAHELAQVEAKKAQDKEARRKALAATKPAAGKSAPAAKTATAPPPPAKQPAQSKAAGGGTTKVAF
jgi:hypothetical protein